MTRRCDPRDHDHAKREPEVWATWRFNGYFEFPDEDGDVEFTCEMRTCPACSMSLSLPLDANGRVLPEVYACTTCGGPCSWGEEGAQCFRCGP